jgi:hypothetical protein
MAQPFNCFCGAPTCRGRIAGARDMAPAQLDGLWLNGHIRALLEERERAAKHNNGTAAVAANGKANGNGHAAATAAATADQTVQALRDALAHAEKVVEAARLALVSYVDAVGKHPQQQEQHHHHHDQAAAAAAAAAPLGAQRRGPTSRELSGEMGGDTTLRV